MNVNNSEEEKEEKKIKGQNIHIPLLNIDNLPKKVGEDIENFQFEQGIMQIQY